MPANNDESIRLQNTTAALPLAYGSIAFYQGPASDEYHTHKWTLYLRSPDPNFDLSKAIRKVIFQLHPSFSVPTRELTEPPFEVTESGWGEFEASMRVEWREEAEERSTILTHGIKLYPQRSASSPDPSAYMNTTVPVVSEKYDEVVFTNPKIEFHNLLLSGNKTKITYPLSREEKNIEYFRIYGDEDDVQTMLAAKKFLEDELTNVRGRLLKADGELEEIKTSLSLIKSSEPVKPVASSEAAAATSKGDGKSKSGKKLDGKKSKKKASGEPNSGGATKKAKTEPKVKSEQAKKNDLAESSKIKAETVNSKAVPVNSAAPGQTKPVDSK